MKEWHPSEDYQALRDGALAYLGDLDFQRGVFPRSHYPDYTALHEEIPVIEVMVNTGSEQLHGRICLPEIDQRRIESDPRGSISQPARLSGD